MPESSTKTLDTGFRLYEAPIQDDGLRAQCRWCYTARMDLEDLQPKKTKRYELGQDLSKLSVGELKALIDDLKGEIARVEATLTAKQSSKSAAEAAFKC